MNDLAKDGPVAYHEGMHSITTPIAGWEGTEGAAMNEGQADSWMYTITGLDAIGEHSVKGALYRARFRARGIDPDTIAYIRSAHSTLKYSTIGTWKGAATDPPAFEEHKDGEVFAATMFELRSLMMAAEPRLQFKRPGLLDGQPTKQISRGQESYERLLLGQAYVLGLSNPDTMVNARDAIIQADRILYSTNPSDLEAPGQHEALIWQVFAAREIGQNAQGLQGGVVTISTAVPTDVSNVAHTGAPQGITIAPGSANRTIKVAWQPVAGAYAYEVFKRRLGSAGQRQYKGIPGRPYFDGDNSVTGWTHVGYSTDANFEDVGSIHEVFAPGGISSKDDASGFNEMFDTEYSVRAISGGGRGVSTGFSDLSASATMNSAIQDVSSAIDTTNTNVTFANGVFQFDQALKNKGTLTAADKTMYGPVNLRVMNISNPTVTSANSDNGGDGHANPALFGYAQSLASGQTSSSRQLKFNDPAAQLFTFDALVTARVRGAANPPANGSQSYDGDGGGTQTHTVTTKTDTYTGTVVIGTVEAKGSVAGVDYVDVPFTAQPGSFGVTGNLSFTTPADLDMDLLDSDGHVLSSSGNAPLQGESCSAVITPGKTYIYRVYGYVAAATQFTIESTQYSSDSITQSGNSFSGGQTSGTQNVHLVRFTVNPITKIVTAKLL